MGWRGDWTGEEPVRLNKFLAQSGVCSRREADALIAQGLVSVDGAPVLDAEINPLIIRAEGQGAVAVDGLIALG